MSENSGNIKAIYRFLICGGGTGGHLYPALAIADGLKERFPGCEILFAGAIGKIEMEKVPLSGYKIIGLNIGGLKRKKIFSNLSLPVKILSSIIKSMKILNNFKPDVVIGTGGYASFPVIYMALRKKLPVLIQEQNFFPGITNRLFSKKVKKICVVDEKLSKYFPVEKIVVSGNPVRKNLSFIIARKDEFFKEINLEPGKFTILVLGGSLGARSINEGVLSAVEIFAEHDVQMIWQTGKIYFNEMLERLDKKYLKSVSIMPFIDNMDKAYSMSDFIICRAGAITISELAIMKKPAILIPSPNVAEDHQTKNAISLVEHNAALMVKDSEVKENLAKIIKETVGNKILLKSLSENIGLLGRPESTKMIVEEIRKLINC